MSKYNFMSYTQSSIHLLFFLNKNNFPTVRRGEWENRHSLTDRPVQLPDCEELVLLWALQDMANPKWFIGRSSATLSLCPHWNQDVVDTRQMLKIQQPAVTSRTLSFNFYLSACLWGLIQPAFGKEWYNFPPLSLSVQGQPLSYECTPWSGFVNLYKRRGSGSQNRNPP